MMKFLTLADCNGFNGVLGSFQTVIQTLNFKVALSLKRVVNSFTGHMQFRSARHASFGEQTKTIVDKNKLVTDGLYRCSHTCLSE